MNYYKYSTYAILILFIFVSTHIQVDDRGERKNPKPGNKNVGDYFLADIHVYRGNVILGRPSDHSITASVMMNVNADVRIIYGVNSKLNSKTGSYKLVPGIPVEIVLKNLQPDSLYQYRIIDSKTSKPFLPADNNGTFHTQRPKGADFVFTVTADSHLDNGCLPELYETTLRNIQKSSQDFHIDLGDTFMTGKHESRASAEKQYIAQRYYFGFIGSSVPVFLALGNHDGEEANKRKEQGSENLAVWSCIQRKKYFPNPEPDEFYTGDLIKNPKAGLLQDYYSSEWGDALFVVLDPYWYSGDKKDGDNPWNMTIGKTQYDWLVKTLRKSDAKYKFIFIHQLMGGFDKNERGGIEVSNLYEWGGHEPNGEYTFAANRPGWEKPLHDLFKETGVTIVFHGHDHFFAQQERDGIIYQLVPQPDHRNYKDHHSEEYGYKSGNFLPSSGHIKVHVSPEGVDVEYIRSATPDMSEQGIRNGEIVFRYRYEKGKRE